MLHRNTKQGALLGHSIDSVETLSQRELQRGMAHSLQAVGFGLLKVTTAFPEYSHVVRVYILWSTVYEATVSSCVCPKCSLFVRA